MSNLLCQLSNLKLNYILGITILLLSFNQLSAQALNGTYTVDPNSTASNNYTSLLAVVNDLNTYGISGAVVIDVLANSGPYNGSIEFGAINGASATNTIRINGNGNAVVDSNTVSNRQMLILNGTNYLTIDNLKFQTLDDTYGWGALIMGGAQYDTIINCEFDLSSITGTSDGNSSGIVFSNSRTSVTNKSVNGSNCYIANNYIKGTTGAGGYYYGLVINGASENNIFENNVIENFYHTAIYLNEAPRSQILYNEIHRSTKTSDFDYKGIRTNGNGVDIQIIGNKFHTPYGGTGVATSDVDVMQISGKGTSANPNIIANNIIYNMNQGGRIRGLYVTSGHYYLVYHNTVNIDQVINSNGSSYGIYGGSINTGSEFKNNIINITAGGTGTKYGFYYQSANSLADAQKNNVYVNSSQGGTQYYGRLSTNFTTQAAFHLTYPTFEVNSPVVDPLFMNPSQGNLFPRDSSLAGVGENLSSFVPFDINEMPRPAAPYIGAFEGGVFTPTVPYYPIGLLNTSNSLGIADSLEVYAWTSGIVVRDNIDTSGGLGFTLVDMASNSQEGIFIYADTLVDGYVVTEGDSIKVRGEVRQSFGLTQFFADSIEILSTGNAIPSALAVNTLNENSESKLIELTNYVLLDSSQTGTYEMRAFNGSDTITILISEFTAVSDSLSTLENALSIGDTLCTFTGIGSQYDSSVTAPYLNGYYIVPMHYADIEVCRLSLPTSIETYANPSVDLTFYPNPTSGDFTVVSSGLESDNAMIIIHDINGRLLLEESINNSNQAFKKEYSLYGEAKGLYLISIIDGNDRITKKLVIK